MTGVEILGHFIVKPINGYVEGIETFIIFDVNLSIHFFWEVHHKLHVRFNGRPMKGCPSVFWCEINVSSMLDQQENNIPTIIKHCSN